MINYQAKFNCKVLLLSLALSSFASAKTISVYGQDQQPSGGAENQSSLIKEIASDDLNIQPVPSSVISSKAKTNSRMTYTIRSGENTLIPVSLGQPNRIVTPFSEPVVQTIKKNEIKIRQEGNVIYFTAFKDNPVAMYITNKGDESKAISLSLHPQKRPPVEATLLLEKDDENMAVYNSGKYYTPTAPGNKEVADKWEKSDSYTRAITKLLRNVALGDVPAGYEIMGINNAGISVPNCAFRTNSPQDNIKYTFSEGQYLSGSNFGVIIGVAKNIGNTTVTVDESLCTHPRLAARALWSNNTLEPQQSTEAYFVIRKSNTSEETRSENSRPRLAE